MSVSKSGCIAAQDKGFLSCQTLQKYRLKAATHTPCAVFAVILTVF